MGLNLCQHRDQPIGLRTLLPHLASLRSSDDRLSPLSLLVMVMLLSLLSLSLLSLLLLLLLLLPLLLLCENSLEGEKERARERERKGARENEMKNQTRVLLGFLGTFAADTLADIGLLTTRRGRRWVRDDK